MDFNKNGRLVVICGREMSGSLAAEIEALGYKTLETKKTSVHLEGNLNDAMKLNLHLRYGLYVLYLLKQFKCGNADELYKNINGIAWEDIIPNDEYISIDSRVETESINNTMFPNLKTKDAVVDRLMKKTGKRPDSGPQKENIVLNLYWKDSDCWFYLNTSGRKLSDRNYRKMPFKAPMQECLAAAVIAATGYDGSAPLILPMCGSGTLAIEAAFIATDRVAGLLRSNYAFTHIKGFDGEKWDNLRRQARKQCKKKHIEPIIATDISEEAVDIARKNAMTAGVEHLITFSVCDFAETPMPEHKGIILLNPEYGQRMGEKKQLEEIYKRIGDFFKQKCAGNTGYIFTGNPGLAKKVGLRTSRKIPFFNANIECRLLKYELYQGSKK